MEVGGEVGVEEGVRLVHGDLNGEHVARGGGGRGRDAILAQPVRDGLNGLGRGSDVLLDLGSEMWLCGESAEAQGLPRPW